MNSNGVGPTSVRDAVLDWENEGGQGMSSLLRGDVTDSGPLGWPAAAPSAMATSSHEDRADCMVCSHSPDAHDKIALRYCNATIAGALPRACICRT
jgi:hypothetical protein